MIYRTDFEVETATCYEIIPLIVEYDYEPQEGDGYHEPIFPEYVRITSITDEKENELDLEFFPGIESWLEEEILEGIHRTEDPFLEFNNMGRIR